MVQEQMHEVPDNDLSKMLDRRSGDRLQSLGSPRQYTKTQEDEVVPILEREDKEEDIAIQFRGLREDQPESGEET